MDEKFGVEEEYDAIRNIIAKASDIDPERIVVTKHILIGEVKVDGGIVGFYVAKAGYDGTNFLTLADWDELGLIEFYRQGIVQRGDDGRYTVENNLNDPGHSKSMLEEALRRVARDVQVHRKRDTDEESDNG